tara:strand:- start:322 stop:519 length:198 start_codon:yes stop_codon:yes gene_type:complete
MKFNYKLLLMVFIAILSIFSLTACSDGDAENAGEKIDEAISDTRNQIEDSCEKVKSEMDMKDEDC